MFPDESGNESAPHSGQNIGTGESTPLLNYLLVIVAKLRFRTYFNIGICTLVVRLVWDWRLARIYDSQEQVFDEVVWDGHRTTAAIIVRLHEIQTGRMTAEARILAERFPEHDLSEPINFSNWPELNIEEKKALEKATICIAEKSIIRASSEPDNRLDHMIRAVDDLRMTHNSLESHVVEWISLILPWVDIDYKRSEIMHSFSKSSDLKELAKMLGVESSDVSLNQQEWIAMRSIAKNVVAQELALDDLEKSIREIANTHLPSLSLLLGPLLAAKLCSAAHGIGRLARLPAGTIQVLGAEKAFFMHLRQGTDPPKHGYIFQHPWISKSSKRSRGPIARMLASKAAIACRCDYFGGKPWTTKEIAEIEKKVGEIRSRR